jgi:2-polyprenyl-3-methyl-5-hydroxy-6-metoxy-1,4-benzoquinol methylase
VGDLTVRQYGTSLSDIRSDHVKRYQFATKYVFDEESVLDAACGTGYGSWILSQHSKNVTGMDISEHALDWATKYWSGPEYILGDVQREKLGYYDAIVSFETLEHLSHPGVGAAQLPRSSAFTDCLGPESRALSGSIRRSSRTIPIRI